MNRNLLIATLLAFNCLTHHFAVAMQTRHPLIFQLSPARCGSTALLQSFSQNPEFHILNESMLKPFLLSLKMENPRFRDNDTTTSFDDVKNTILSLRALAPVYCKEIIFFSYDWLKDQDDLLQDEMVKFILLMRHPYDSLISFYKKAGPSICSFQSNGYKQMWDFYLHLKNTITPDRYIVVFTDELFSSPEKTLRQVYQHLGLPFDPKVLAWEPKDETFDGSLWLDQKTVEKFHHWHDDAIKSSGFRPLVPAEHTFDCVEEEDKALIKKLYEEALIYYNYLKEAAS